MALLSLFGGAACIGVAPILVRMSVVGPSATAFYRLLLALPFLWLWMNQSRRAPGTRPATLRDFPRLALAGLLFVGDLAIWHWSLQFTTVANSTLLANVAPIFVTLGAWAFLGERILPRFLGALLLALLGAGLLVGASLQFQPQHLLGDLLSLLAALFYAAYLLSVKLLRREFSGPTIMAWSGLVSCPGFLIAGWALQEPLWPATAQGWLTLAALAWISHLGGQTLIAGALGQLPASYSSIGLLLQPVVAGVLAWIFFNETLGPLQIGGGLVVLAAISLATPRPSKP